MFSCDLCTGTFNEAWKFKCFFFLIGICCILLCSKAQSETLRDALSASYEYNPQLKAQRANTRSIDENLPIAKGSFLPKAAGIANAGILNFNLLNSDIPNSAFSPTAQDLKTITNPTYAAVIVNLNIFNGFRGINGINQAEAQIHQSRQILRATELAILSATAGAYMNVLRDTAICNLRHNYLNILQHQEADTREKIRIWEVMDTDLSQVQTSIAQAKESEIISHVNLKASLSIYKQLTGRIPKNLNPGISLNIELPKSLSEALSEARDHHPLANAALYNVEIYEYALKMAEGELLPSVNLQTSFGQNWNFFGTSGQRLYQGGGSVQLNVPIYDGGVSYGQIRQAKEKLTEAKMLRENQVNTINQQVESAWAIWINTRRYLSASNEEVIKAEKALIGLREEMEFGQRTTWDLLNYQLTLLNARISVVNAQRDRVIGSYNLYASIGKLSAENLNLNVTYYTPTEHSNKVRNQFIGTNPW